MPSRSEESALQFRFFKGAEDILAGKRDADFNWEEAASKTREHLSNAMNSRNLAFLLGSGCSSFVKNGKELGVPTMAPLASSFLTSKADDPDQLFPTDMEIETLRDILGLDIIGVDEYATNLERLMEVLYSTRFVLDRSTSQPLSECLVVVDSLISKVTNYICSHCWPEEFTSGDESVVGLYQAFYRRLIFRDRTLPQPWVFTTNYDLFNETALDRLGTPYCNGFSGTIERRFNPASYRYSLAEQLDVTSQKWTSVDGYVYLCKLHGSVNWIEEGSGLFPIREISSFQESSADRMMIYPSPTKQNASFGSPYSDLFREFQSCIVREQSVLVVIGYSFGDEHINNLIFQALTVPTFRMIMFVNPETEGVVAKLKGLQDPRVWIIGGDGSGHGRRAHYFDTFIESFMPEPPGNAVDDAIAQVLSNLLGRVPQESNPDSADEKR